MQSIRSIGVFDSGLGGLTVLNEICKYNKGLDITYFGDTARVPYGSRTPETIARYAEQDVRFLLSHGVEAIVIACGTVSATCLDLLRKRYRIPFYGVIEPAAKAAANLTKTGRIAVLGTKATVKSNAYTTLIQNENPATRVDAIACPLLVPLIENGFVPDDPIVRLTLDRYLAPIRSSDTDTVILGCTHYPFLKETIQSLLPNVHCINIGTVLAQSLAQSRGGRTMGENRVSYYVSDPDTDFQNIANAYLDAIHAENVQKINIEAF